MESNQGNQTRVLKSSYPGAVALATLSLRKKIPAKDSETGRKITASKINGTSMALYYNNTVIQENMSGALSGVELEE